MAESFVASLLRRLWFDAISGICENTQLDPRSWRGLSRRTALAAAAWGSRIFFREQHIRGIAGGRAGHLALCRSTRRHGKLETRDRRYGIPRGRPANDARRSDGQPSARHADNSHHYESAGLLG